MYDPCFLVYTLVPFLVLHSSRWGEQKEGASGLTLIVSLLLSSCWCAVSLPRGAIGWLVIYACNVS